MFVAHDLSVVRHVSDRIVVMYLGKIVEVSPAEELYDKPIHPYTVGLLGAIPIPDPRENRARPRAVVEGEPPSPIDPPPGCRFHTRCPHATEICRAVEPPLTTYANGHLAACHHPRNVGFGRDRGGVAVGGLAGRRRRGAARDGVAPPRRRPLPSLRNLHRATLDRSGWRPWRATAICM